VYATKAYEGGEAWLHTLLTLALVMGDRQISWSAVLPPVKELL